MTREEFQKLKKYSYARKHAPWSNRAGRRHVKGRAKGVGQILKRSSVKHMSFDPLEKPAEMAAVGTSVSVHFPVTNPVALPIKVKVKRAATDYYRPLQRCA